jgi:hypothetical protein
LKGLRVPFRPSFKHGGEDWEPVSLTRLMSRF